MTEAAQASAAVSVRSVKLWAPSQRDADLRVVQGQTLEFVEAGEVRADSATVRVDIRDSDGSKEALTQDALGPGDKVSYAAAHAGYLSVHTCRQPASVASRHDAWQVASHCEIAHVAVLDGQGRRVLGDEHLTQKIGLPLELRPYSSTARLTPGSELSLRLYHSGASMPGRELVATGPLGATQRVTTNDKGVAAIQIDRPGRWEVFAKVPEPRLPSQEASVRLVFSVPDKGERALERVGVVDARPTQRAQAPSWREIGPNPTTGKDTGRITGLAPHPTDADVFYISTASGGAWRFDSGSWTPLTDELSMLATGSIALDPKAPDTVFVGGGEANFAPHCYYGTGIFKSTDAGKTWKNVGKKVSAGRSVSRIVVSPHDSKLVFASVQRAGGASGDDAARHHPDKKAPMGIYRSKDNGDSFSLMPGLPKDVGATDVAVSLSDDTVVYAALGDRLKHKDHGVYRSKDQGESWQKLSVPGIGSDVGRVMLATSVAEPEAIYVLAAKGTPETNPRKGKIIALWKSTDQGESFKKLNPGNVASGFGWFMLTVGISPKDPQRVVVGGISMVTSSDGGGRFSDISPPHPDVHAVAWDAKGRLLVGDDGGVHRSENEGRRWSSLNKGLGTMQFYPALALHPTNKDWILGGLQDNGTVLWNGSSWRRVFGGDGGYATLHPDAPNVVIGQSQHTGNLMRSTDGGKSFRRSGSGIDKNDRHAFYNPVIFAPDNPKVAYSATHRLYRSDNQGQKWRAISKDLTDGAFFSAVRSIDISKSAPEVIYVVTTDGRVMVSEDSGENFDVRLQGFSDWKRVTKDLVVSSRTPDVAYMGVPRFGSAIGQVVKTSDRGKNWVDISGNLPDVPVASMDHYADPDSDGEGDILFAGTDNDVWVSCSDGKHWTSLGKGRANAKATQVSYQPQFERLVVSTMGRGVWLLENLAPDTLYEICEEGEKNKEDSPQDPDGDDVPGPDDDKSGDSGKGGKDDSKGGGGDDGSGGGEGSEDSGNGSEDSGSKDPGGDEEVPPEDEGGCRVGGSASGGLVALACLALLGRRRREARRVG